MSLIADPQPMMAMIFQDPAAWLPQLKQHAVLSSFAVLLAVVVAIPVGAALTRIERIAFAVISIANLGRTIPSLAMLALIYPFLGTGFIPALVAMTALGIPPILLGTYTGVRAVDAVARDAARGQGMTSLQQLMRVELPIASPIIFSGVRTSAVQVVASATLAALIGGGGLGETILAGLATLRYDVLVTGALLVAMLAAITEIGFAQLEKRVVPRGVGSPRGGDNNDSGGGGRGYRAGGGVTARQWQLASIGSLSVAFVASFGGIGVLNFVETVGSDAVKPSGNLPTVVLGSKDFTEQYVLGELYAQALAAQGYGVERRFGLGATAVADSALRRSDIDMYPEYTGTALLTVLKQTPPEPEFATADGADGPPGSVIDPSAHIYDLVSRGYSKRGITLLEPSEFSNGFAIVMKQSTAKRLNVRTLSDLAKVADEVTFGAVPDFKTREDGLSLLARRYDMHFRAVRTFEGGIKYKALADDKVDAIYAFETDGRIEQDKLFELEDDLHIWPPYHVVPMVEADFAAKAGPKFAETLNAVSALLDTPTMRRLNNDVDHHKLEPEEVAHDFLKEHDLL